jgi:hypothetical protein
MKQKLFQAIFSIKIVLFTERQKPIRHCFRVDSSLHPTFVIRSTLIFSEPRKVKLTVHNLRSEIARQHRHDLEFVELRGDRQRCLLIDVISIRSGLGVDGLRKSSRHAESGSERADPRLVVDKMVFPFTNEIIAI